MASQATGKTSVLSRDGTQIVYWASGDGPPLVLVHGHRPTTRDGGRCFRT